MPLAPLSASSVTPSATHSQVGPFWCCFLSGWVCVFSRPLWVSPRNSPVRLGVSLAAASTPQVFSISGLKLYFPELELWVSEICHLVHQLLPCWLAAALPTQVHNPPPLWVCQPVPRCESSLPDCPSLPLPLVWMNVSSLSPWLSDFHTVLFSVSSGCFLFLNFCCPSFGCARRHSVST